MTPAEYTHYQERSHISYSRDVSKAAGIPLDTAAEKARQQVRELLPQGMRSKDHFFFSAFASESQGENPRGMLWFAIRNEGNVRRAFVCDIHVEPEHRGKGYGTMMLKWLEKRAKDLGLRGIGLHVFAHNSGARRLYERFGYQTTNIVMRKDF